MKTKRNYKIKNKFQYKHRHTSSEIGSNIFEIPIKPLSKSLKEKLEKAKEQHPPYLKEWGELPRRLTEKEYEELILRDKAVQRRREAKSDNFTVELLEAEKGGVIDGIKYRKGSKFLYKYPKSAGEPNKILKIRKSFWSRIINLICQLRP